MQPIRRDEIKDLTGYERVRSELRKQVMEIKRTRRVLLGEKISIVFENRQTVLYQIQEMIRAERIVEEPAIAHEMETYNELLPKAQSLAGTLFLELTDARRIREELESFLGLDRGEHLWFDLGGAGKAYARFAEGQSEEGRISSVHYVQFPFANETAEAFANPMHPVQLVVEHPSYRASSPVDGALRRSLIEDLKGA
jgi:hypothetical protein